MEPIASPKIELVDKYKVPYILISNTLNEEEISSIQYEVANIINNNAFSKNTSQATNETGESERESSSVFLADIFTKLENSNIHKSLSKVIPILLGPLNGGIRSYGNWFFDNLGIFKSEILVSYYTKGGYYKPHRDTSYITCITYLTENYDKYDKTPAFSGGDLVLTDYNITIPYKHNTTIIFPGFVRHEATEVTSSTEDKGRIAIVQFGYRKGEHI
jgi:Rps23 Pro-64 3,4-dihydroxylase Tpa1-like proline 4-hydroxylase